MTQLQNVELSLKSIGVTTPTLQHLGCICLRRDTHQNAFLYAPDLFGALGAQIAFQLAVHHRGGNQQCKLTQSRQLVLFSKARGVVLYASQHGLFRRCVDHRDFVGAVVQELAGDDIGGPFSRDPLDLVLKILEVLNIHGGRCIIPNAQQLLHILPSMAVPALGWIVISQTVNQRDFGPALNDRVEIDRLPAIRGDRRNDFHLIHNKLGLGWIVWLQSAGDDVFAPLTAAPSFIEHLKRLSDSAGVTQEHFQPATLLAALLQFDLGQQLIGSPLPRVIQHGPYCIQRFERGNNYRWATMIHQASPSGSLEMKSSLLLSIWKSVSLKSASTWSGETSCSRREGDRP